MSSWWKEVKVTQIGLVIRLPITSHRYIIQQLLYALVSPEFQILNQNRRVTLIRKVLLVMKKYLPMLRARVVLANSFGRADSMIKCIMSLKQADLDKKLMKWLFHTDKRIKCLTLENKAVWLQKAIKTMNSYPLDKVSVQTKTWGAHITNNKIYPILTVKLVIIPQEDKVEVTYPSIIQTQIIKHSNMYTGKILQSKRKDS